MTSLDSFKCCKTLKVGSKTYAYYSLPAAEKNGLKGISRLPFSLKVLLENLLRNEDGKSVTKDDILAFAAWLKTKTSDRDVAFRPARVLMQDFTGVPAVVDLAAMRDAMEHLGGDAKKINPLVPVDLVIDHSVAVNFFGNKDACHYFDPPSASCALKKRTSTSLGSPGGEARRLRNGRVRGTSSAAAAKGTRNSR